MNSKKIVQTKKEGKARKTMKKQSLKKVLLFITLLISICVIVMIAQEREDIVVGLERDPGVLHIDWILSAVVGGVIKAWVDRIFELCSKKGDE